MSQDIQNRIKVILIETLNLEDVQPDDIQAEESLMGGGLELDSIDALELVVLVEKEFGIKIKNSEEAKKALQSVASLEQYIKAKQASSQ